MNDKKYLIEYRLSEVISLIVALSRSENTFRSNSGLDNSFRATAKSASTWLEVASEHPEFFRLGRDQKNVALLIRFLDKADATEGDARPTLSIEETQKLVDQAIELHDRQLSRSQRKSYLIPFYSAVLTSIVAIVLAILNSSSNSKISDRIDTLTIKVDTLTSLIKK